MFIVIDGLDGAGKGTQLGLVKSALEQRGKKVLTLDFPRYGEDSAFMVEKYLNGKYGSDVPSKRASVFYAIDRYDDLHDRASKLSEYDYVISNRYVSASMIHQTGKLSTLDERKEFLHWLDHFEYSIMGIPRPDAVFFLDVSPTVSQKLVEKKEKRDYISGEKNKDLHEADPNHLQNAYDAAHDVLKIFPDWQKIDCCQDGDILPKEVITQKILSRIL